MVDTLWYVRTLRDEINVNELYGDNPTLFSLKVHHGGMFTKFPHRMYVGGQVSYVDLMDVDEFSVFEINMVVLKLGYSGNEKMFYHYRVPGQDLNFGLSQVDDGGVVTQSEQACGNQGSDAEGIDADDEGSDEGSDGEGGDGEGGDGEADDGAGGAININYEGNNGEGSDVEGSDGEQDDDVDLDDFESLTDE
ncbi:hypothetical protein QVD17_41613 [Tagetes erecta]|uniref:PB1-like domain-containing protein n=1 Tax=Tagetes erecta TaxID=13708 RepID=A0AAD8JMT8_TARER|nr:hypothetical protein QVD17_41613 [Tagetes erecta]